MTKEDIIKKLKSHIRNAEFCNSFYCENVDVDLLKEIIELLSLKSVINKKTPFGDFTNVCPRCGNPIINVWSHETYKPKYCHYCGQQFGWENENV